MKQSNYYIRRYGKSYALYNRHTKCRISSWDRWKETIEILKETFDKEDRKTKRIGGLMQKSTGRFMSTAIGPL